MREIAVRNRHVMDEDAQALAAATFTLMTAYVHAADEAEHAEVARQVSANLRRLQAMESLDPAFRRLCGRLQALWRTTAGG